MSELNQISNLEEVYFQLQAIKKQMIALENYVLAHLDRDDSQPVKPVMVDPRTGKEFKSRGHRDGDGSGWER